MEVVYIYQRKALFHTAMSIYSKFTIHRSYNISLAENFDV